jgi:hypothetical protein
MNITDKIIQLVIELDGGVMFPQENNKNELLVSFNRNGKSIIDQLQMEVCRSEKEFGVKIKSFITNGKLVDLAIWTFLLVEKIESEFNSRISLKPITSKYYFLGEKKIINN